MMLPRGLCALMVTAVIFVAGSAGADPYRLVPGDRVSLSLTTQGTSTDMTVDIDGQLRVPGAGGVTVAGTTLDEAEEAIVRVITEGGVFLNPDVSVQMVEYAPVIVSGDVSGPGQYTYIPGMTVGAALALSGGSQARGISRFEVDRARIENEGFMRTINLDIAAAALRIARLQSLLDDGDTYDLTEELLTRIPAPHLIAMDRLQAAEVGLFDTAKRLISENLASWEEEIKLIEQQLALFEDRIAVQDGIIEATERELATARDLQSRGLQTASRLASVEQRDADARARALELASARINAVQALAQARRARTSFLRNRREDWLSALQSARLVLEDREIAYARRTEAQSILTGSSANALMNSDMIEPTYRIISPRVGGDSSATVDLDQPLLPGDMLVVTLGVAEAAQGQ